MRIASDAVVPALLSAGTAGAALLGGWTFAGVALLVLAAGVLLFFRDPRRAVPQQQGLLVSPADGKVVAIVPEQDGRTRLSIFLSIFDVHINRSPLAGRVESVDYNPGSFLPAFDHKASDRNEQNRIRLTDGRHVFEVVQIAGLVARRIVCRLAPGDQVARGERFGLIKFGSRVDLHLPAGVELLVQVGDRVRGGSSVIGRLADEGRVAG